MSENLVTVRLEKPQDITGIRAVHVASFPTPAEAQLVELLRQAGRLQVSLVAEVDNSVVGHVGFSPVTTETELTGTGLGPVAVLEDYRRRGIAEELIRAGLDACRFAGIGWVVVLGNPMYYNRFGFRAASGFGLSNDYGEGPAFQALELISGQMPREAGLVKYAPEFAVVA